MVLIDILDEFLLRKFILVGIWYYVLYIILDKKYCVLFVELDNEYDNNVIKVFRWIFIKKMMLVDKDLGIVF